MSERDDILLAAINGVRADMGALQGEVGNLREAQGSTTEAVKQLEARTTAMATKLNNGIVADVYLLKEWRANILSVQRRVVAALIVAAIMSVTAAVVAWKAVPAALGAEVPTAADCHVSASERE